MNASRCRWSSARVQFGGTRLHVRRAGHGPPLLFLHGYPETSLAWRYAFDALHEQYTCVAPDLTGWGQSESAGRLTLRRLMDDTVALIQALRLDRPVLVGHDWGAAVAYGLALHRPDLLRRLVTVNFSPGRFEFTRPLHFYFFALPLLPEVALDAWPERSVEWILRWWAAKPEAFPPEVLRAYQQAARPRTARRATLSYYRDLVRGAAVGRPPLGMGPTGRRHGNPRVPWDVIWGMRDPVATPRVLQYLREEFPSLRVFPIADSGHFPHEESPADFMAALEQILAPERAEVRPRERAELLEPAPAP